MMFRLLGLLMVPSALLLIVPTTNAQSPEPTTTAPAVSLMAPADLVVQAESVRWRDDSTGEAGYRVVATLGSENRTFDLPPDSASLALPEDFRPSCATLGRTILSVRVFAFSGAQEGPAVTGESTMLCPPAATPTRSNPSALPSTGLGERSNGDNDAPVIAAIAAVICAVASIGISELWRRRSARSD
jgi:hypothetical protein